MADHKHRPDAGIGEELDLETVVQEASRVQRRALDLDFGDVIPDEGPSPGAAAPKRHGGASLDADAFLSKKEREARARAAGATPTLDRLGHRHVAPRSLVDDDTRMDTNLNIRTGGLPGWAWALVAVTVLGLGLGGVWYTLWQNRQDTLAAEAAAIQAAQQRARAEEETRLRKLDE